MPTQQRLEGPDLEQLLTDARTEFGPDVAIVEANKVRSGGIGGFFAREGFEVVVEVDDEPAATRPAPSLLDLAAAVEDEAITPTAASLSTDGAAFAEVLGRLMADTRDHDGAERDADALDDFEDAFQPYTEQVGTRRGRVLRAERADADIDASATPTRPPASMSRPAPSSDRPLAPMRLRTRTPATTVDAATSPLRRSTSEAVLAGRPAVDLDVDGLRRLGLPSGYLDEPTQARDRMSALIELARRFPEPEPLPLTKDALIVLVGDRSGMQDSVDWVHDTLRIDVATMLVATRRDVRMLAPSRRIDDAEDALVRRRSLRRREHPIVVAIDEPVGRRGIAWARGVLHALEPTVVWGVVDAHRKAEDVADWCERLGGVDAIAIDNTEETASPGDILATGVPISMIDGRPATPVRWAAVLDERLRAA